jgi:hypothetical protein
MFFSFWIRAYKRELLEEICKKLCATTNFLEVLVDDEEAILAKLNRVCGKDQHIFSKVRITKRKLHITFNPTKK